MTRDRVVFALKLAVSVLEAGILFGARLFAQDFVQLRTEVWNHKREYGAVKAQVDTHIQEQERQLRLLQAIAAKLQVQ